MVIIDVWLTITIKLGSKLTELILSPVSWFSLVIGQNAGHQLVTSSENVVASSQSLVALATSELQFRALLNIINTNVH